MAVRSRSGVGGAVYALVIFVILWVISSVLAVMFYVQRLDRDKSATVATEALTEFVSGNERSHDAVLKVKAAAKSANRSVVGELLDRVETLASWTTGARTVDTADLLKQFKDAGIDPEEGQYILGAVAQLQTDLDTQKQQVAGLEEAESQRNQQVEQLRTDFSSAQQKHGTVISGLKVNITSLQDDLDKFQKDSSQQRQGLVNQYKEQLDKLRTESGQKDATIRQFETTQRQLQEELDKYTGKQTKDPLVPDPVKEIDGRIIAVRPEENLAYINLGSEDKLFMGLTFSVYDAAVGVQYDQAGQVVPGKAVVEVVDILESSAACRIVARTAGQTVLANDLLVNVAYDRNRTYKFYVHGNFDLNRDGVSGLTDYEQIVSRIRKWGGEVITEAEARDMAQRIAELGIEGDDEPVTVHLSADVDFLVIGREPPIPSPSAGEGGDDLEREVQIIQARKKYQEYSRLVSEAKALSIPVLNQNRFLSLVGYYQP